MPVNNTSTRLGDGDGGGGGQGLAVDVHKNVLTYNNKHFKIYWCNFGNQFIKIWLLFVFHPFQLKVEINGGNWVKDEKSKYEYSQPSM